MNRGAVIEQAVERNVIASYQVTQSLGFKGDLRQWAFIADSRVRVYGFAPRQIR
jgi:hypothetical protein